MPTQPLPSKVPGRRRFSQRHVLVRWEDRRNHIIELAGKSPAQRKARYPTIAGRASLLRPQATPENWDSRPSFQPAKPGVSGIPSSPRAPSLAAWERETRCDLKCAIRSMVRTSHRITRRSRRGLALSLTLGKDNFMGRDALLEQKPMACQRSFPRSAFRRNRLRFDRTTRCLPTEEAWQKPPVAHCRQASAVALRWAIFHSRLPRSGQDLEIEVRGRRYRACRRQKPFYKPES